ARAALFPYTTLFRSKNGCSTKNLRDYLNVIKISTESVSKMGALGFVLTKHEEVPLNTLAEFEARVRHLFGGSANEELFYGHSGRSEEHTSELQSREN